MRIIACAFACAFLAGIAASKQAKSPHFGVASVRRATAVPGAPSGISGRPGTKSPGRITCTNTPMLAILQRAYRLQFYQIIGPKWLVTEYYDIIANVPESATEEDLRLMLQALLSERFHLSARHETKTIQAYQLVVAGSGPKLTAANSDPSTKDASADPRFLTPSKSGIYLKMERVGDEQGIYLTAKSQTLSDVAKFFTRQMGAPVSDHTGLNEKYDFTLAYQPIVGDTFDASSVPYLPAALEKKLGLKLIVEKTDIDTLVIDHMDMNPVQN